MTPLSHLFDAFLAGDGLFRSLARPRIGSGSLTAYRKMGAMPHAPVTLDVLQSADIRLYDASQLPFHLTSAINDPGNPCNFFLGEVLRLCDSVRRGDTTVPQLDRGGLVGAINDDPDALHDYIKRLLDGAEGELAARLLESDSS